MENNVYNDNPQISETVLNNLASAYAEALNSVKFDGHAVTPAPKTVVKAASSVTLAPPPPAFIPANQTDRLLRQILEELRAIRQQLDRNRRIRLS